METDPDLICAFCAATATRPAGFYFTWWGELYAVTVCAKHGPALAAYQNAAPEVRADLAVAVGLPSYGFVVEDGGTRQRIAADQIAHAIMLHRAGTRQRI